MCRLDQLPLAPGRYGLSLDVTTFGEGPIDTVDQAVWFDVVASDVYGNGRLPSPRWGRFIVRSRWEVVESPPAANSAAAPQDRPGPGT